MHEEVEFIEGRCFNDERGTLNCVNDFSFSGIKRFYQIKQKDPTVVRAWQGHQVERKYFFVNHGTFFIAWVKIDDFANPSPHLAAEHTVLSADKPGILAIPAGYANGFKAMEPNSILSVYSNFTLRESEDDRCSFDSSLWMKWPN
jgi:dTDP-4-dehydrorhamnose 3,5-epimerase-like enzyme